MIKSKFEEQGSFVIIAERNSLFPRFVLLLLSYHCKSIQTQGGLFNNYASTPLVRIL